MPERKLPVRRCVHCGSARPKGELIRIVRTPSGEIEVDETQRRAGRGTYVCPQAACIEGLLRSKHSAALLGRALPRDLVDKLKGAAGR